MTVDALRVDVKREIISAVLDVLNRAAEVAFQNGEEVLQVDIQNAYNRLWREIRDK